MIEVRRLLPVGAILATAAILTCSHVWGEPGLDQDLKTWRKGDGKNIQPALNQGSFADERESNRFEDKPVVAYRSQNGEQFFALQVQPKLPDAPDRPRDFLVILDTSASKANGPLLEAQKITEELSRQLRPDDRMAVWTANINPRDITRGFKSGKDMPEPLRDLARELPLGAVDLKKTLDAALASFEITQTRQRVVVFLGDGRSIAQPLDAAARGELAENMIRKQVAFFGVPMGARIDPANFHGLINATGGKCVRTSTTEATPDLVKRLVKDVAEPILYPERFQLSAGVKESMPTNLPPLRRDLPALVVGKLDGGVKTLDYKLSGTVVGRDVQDDRSHAVPASDPEHFFLVGVIQQWKHQKDQPALLAADRALAHAHKQNQLAVEDLLAKAEMALEDSKIEAARRLFEQAEQLAPHSPRARGGLALVERMKAGKLTRMDMLKELQLNTAKREVVRLEKGQRKIVVLDDGDEKEDPPAVDPEKQAIDDVRQRRAIAEQQANLMVNEAVRQANRVVRNNPDEAYELLKQTLEGLRGNIDLEPAAILNLGNRLTRSMESVRRLGEVVKRDQAEALALRAAADARTDLRRAETMAQDRVRERMRVFHNLMDQAREAQAQEQALLMRDELVNRGLPVPQSVTAGYQIAQSRYHLTQEQELRRLRQDRFLSTLLEVERSHVPFPDEPPVVFPDSALIRRITHGRYDNWKDWAKYRIERYSVSTFGADNPSALNRVRELLNARIERYGGLDDPKTTLIEALDQLQKAQLSKLPGGRDVIFDINQKAFKYEQLNDVLKTEIANPDPIPAMDNVTVGTVLKRILARIPVPSGATYIIRPGTIEITTGQFATAEKAIRVYPVADLVTPIPSAINPLAVSQTATILGSLGQLGIAGGLGALGAGGLNLGALGALGGGLQLGALGALGGALGVQLGGALGVQLGGVQLGGALGQVGQLGVAGQLGQVGQPGFNMQGNNLGVGGGAAGFTGGQLGQLGNLGGQFGMQGGDQSQLLITLITQVVGRQSDWAPRYDPVTGQPLNPLDDQMADGEGGLNQDNNNLGYYPPALALVVKAPSIIHTRPSNLVITAPGAGAGGGGFGMAPNEGKILVNGRQPVRAVANAGNEKKPDDKKKLDPREIWQNALVKGVKDPGLIIATADYLALNAKFEHAAEFLKANLRQGVVVKPWVYQSLAIALRESGGSAEEIERAEVSGADLEPMNSAGFLLAARALAEDRNYERALAFCKQAAELNPGVPHAYADAARYAEMARDTRAMQWAASNLLRQEWPVRNSELQQLAVDKLESLCRQVDGPQADRMRSVVQDQRRRDLVVKLLWQGEADLDLKVTEPTGSICSSLTRQTIGGGTLMGDTMPASGVSNETYVAPEAFDGEYRITVERVWGKPLGNKAQLKIIRFQGTPQESEQLVTLKINSTLSEPLSLPLEGGRRTETAYVPPAGAHQPIEEESAALETTDQVLNKLRALANPEVTGVERAARGSVVSAGRPVIRSTSSATPRHHEKDRTLIQNKVSSLVANSMEVTARAVLAADRQSIRLSLSPVVNTAVNARPPQVVSPVFPGAPAR